MTSQATPETSSAILLAMTAVRWGSVPVTSSVSTREVDPRTMMSKLVPGLYFAGEMLDVDGTTGGFNLQIAFSTGALAGRSAAKEAEA